MADNKDEKQTAKEEITSFKERILAELQEATRIRQEREEAAYQAEQQAQEERKTAAELLAKELEKRSSSQGVKDKVADKSSEAQVEPGWETSNLSKVSLSPTVTSETVFEPVEFSEFSSKLDQEEELLAQPVVFSQTLSSSESVLASEFSSVAASIESEVADQPKASLTPDSLLNVTAGRQEVNQVLDDLERVFSPEMTDKATSVKEAEATTIDTLIADVKGWQEEVLPSSDLDFTSLDVASSESEAMLESNSELAEHDKAPLEEVAVPRETGRERRDHMAKKLALYIISVTVVVLLALGVFGTYYVYSALQPVDSKAKSYVQIEIPAGSGTKMIGQILQQNGLIKNAAIFNYYSKFKNYSNYQSGYFNLQKSMSLDTIAKALQEEGTSQPSQPVLGKVLVKEGYTIEQIASAIEVNANSKNAEKTPYSADDFRNLMKDDTFIAKMVEKYPTLLANIPSKEAAVYQLEGYLFPATYDYYEGTSLEDLVDSMLATMNNNLSSYYASIASKNMTVNDILTMASLIEKEGQTDDDRRLIASVFYNRLNAGQALQSNIAVLYAMGKLGEVTTLAEDANIDTGIDSPYNDYTHTGLMPGPVDSPGLSAIEAAINPDSSDYFYFVADVKTGKVYYSEDYETHQKNVEQYVNSQISN
ncbi:endolytic transglycosylase MltG [Streptococcus sp. zg-JUN1979]|uniref:endolytic transglycosylase MltG n=1 Tax=Streptococcus sp. zg-JUN1979 TaxID=3391450 RepID=UPI0039A40C6F